MYRVLWVLRSPKFALGRSSRPALVRAVLLTLLLLSGCRPRGSPAGEAQPVDRSSVLLAPASIDVEKAALSTLPMAILGTLPLPLYDADPAHPWNRLHHALHVHPGKVSRASCRDSSRSLPTEDESTGCANRVVPLDPWPPLIEGPAGYGDVPAIFAWPSVSHLGDPARLAALLALIQAASARSGDKLQQPWAALLFQSDLWARFDTLDAACRDLMAARSGTAAAGEGPRDDTLRSRLLFLRDAIGQLIREVALPARTIAKLPSNWPQLATAYPALLAGFPGPMWQEVITYSRDRPAPMPSPEKGHTRHAEVAGFRAVFRRYVAVPDRAGGGEWLRRELAAEPATPKMPVGTRLLILQVPLAVSSEGEIVPWTRTNLIELRTVLPSPDANVGGAQPTRLADLPFDVLEGRRPWLRLPDPPQAGLQQLPGDAAFPLGGTCGPQPFSLNPLRAVCMTCHGRTGEILLGTMTHGPQRTKLLTSVELPTTLVQTEKRRRPDWRALASRF